MSTAINFTGDHESIGIDGRAGEKETKSLSCRDEVRWTTKQVIAACLWSAFFALGCGYGWALLQIAADTWR